MEGSLPAPPRRGTPREAPTLRGRWCRSHAVTQRRSRIAKEDSSGKFLVNLATERKLVFETDIRRRQASNRTVRYTPVGIGVMALEQLHLSNSAVGREKRWDPWQYVWRHAINLTIVSRPL
jgi:hypothetical protein